MLPDVPSPTRDRPIRDLVIILAMLVTVPLFSPVAVHAVSSVVGIADNDSITDLARVDTGRLRVGDGSGALTVDGLVTPDRRCVRRRPQRGPRR
jgi:hypothetical protein